MNIFFLEGKGKRLENLTVEQNFHPSLFPILAADSHTIPSQLGTGALPSPLFTW